jgi:transcription elongation GreA/GreB family factor
MTLKEKVYNNYQDFIAERISMLRNMIIDLAEDAQNDAKGSAGDKHETALSMMHLEQEKLNQKLKEVLEHKAILDGIDSEKSASKVVMGSLVEVKGMLFFVSCALPKIVVDGHQIIALSPHSPLGKEMLGKVVGQSFGVNASSFVITSIT